ncbi:GerMN domain-containing protein [Streptomyces sp. RerS4]|nr:GerMN domain-containing protein [Streptomyces sp. RerS4]UQX05116.1 GerMN domain-containing protein [Streptomyces sp. RerS4]
MAGVVGLCALGALTTGCGIRATTVPVDVGAAPSRVSCENPDEPAPGQGGVQGLRTTVELVCGSQLVGVERLVPVPEKRPARDAVVSATQALLEALQKEPSAGERDAGFTTGVPAGLTASAPRPGDPAGTVRLSRKPEDLPPVALSQIVCTLADSDAVSEGPGPVVLGGPDADPPRAWECSDEVRSRPEAVPTLGDVVRPGTGADAAAGTPAPTPGPSKS